MKSIILCFRTAVFVLRFALLTTLILLCLVHATDTQVRAEVTARFEVGAIAEYTNAAHNNQNPSLFSQNPRSIESVLLKQSSEVWGGTQGNDSDVTLQINYFNGSVLTLSGAFSWVKNSGGGVRRQGFWHQRRLKLRESSAHLVDCIMRRACCDASVAFRVSFV